SVLMSSVTFDTFTAVHLCSSSLVHTCHLYDDFSVMLTTRAFDQRRLLWFAPCSCKPSAMDLPSSLALLSTAHSHSVINSETIKHLEDIFFKGLGISHRLQMFFITDITIPILTHPEVNPGNAEPQLGITLCLFGFNFWADNELQFQSFAVFSHRKSDGW
ncbi:MAG: hypothetical protein NT163_00525, partial [Chlorobiales bacterium]|nr:hypothetical protein [Chlorobiales bacterium]